MEQRINDVLIHYVEHGSGVPLLALHGAGVDHREMEAAIEAVVPGSGYRRIYPDLPGMGRSTTGDLGCNDDVVALIADFIDRLEAGPVLLLGHSYGAYLARGVAAQRPEIVRALSRIFAEWSVDVGSGAFPAPTLIAAGRRDSIAGYTDAVDLLERYPHATLAVIDGAGHALMHERPELLAALLSDWLDRARPDEK